MPKFKKQPYNLRTSEGRTQLLNAAQMLVNGGTKTNREISEKLGVSMDQSRRALNRLIAEDAITYQGEARFTTYHPVA